jgi:hypothetical protein
MNERIEKLAEQATSSRNQYDPKTMMTERIQEFDKEKFAELIVRECAKVAEDIQKFYDEHNDSQVNTEIWTMIKEHFGVEE